MVSKKETINCPICNKSFKDWKYRIRKFCSIKCKNINQSIAFKNHIVTDETKIKIGLANKNKLLGIVPKSAFKKGSATWNKGKKGYLSGNKHYNWQGGKTIIYDLIRNSLESKQWKLNVFQKDNFTCVECGKKDRTIEAHHLKRFSAILKEFLQEYSQFSPIEDKETLLRLAITYKPFWETSNGKTLCENCHNLISSLERRKKW